MIHNSESESPENGADIEALLANSHLDSAVPYSLVAADDPVD